MSKLLKETVDHRLDLLKKYEKKVNSMFHNKFGGFITQINILNQNNLIPIIHIQKGSDLNKHSGQMVFKNAKEQITHLLEHGWPADLREVAEDAEEFYHAFFKQFHELLFKITKNNMTVITLDKSFINHTTVQKMVSVYQKKELNKNIDKNLPHTKQMKL